MATQVQIELTVDEKGAVQGVRNFDTAVKGATGSVKELGAATAATGEVTQTLAQSNASALEAYMAKTKQVTKAVTQSAAVSQQQVKALMAQVEGLQAMGPKAMKIFNEQITGFQKQGFGPFESQTRAIQSTLQLLEQQKTALGGVASAGGEARVVLGGLTGSWRAMDFGLASMMGRMKGLAPLWQAAMPLAMMGAGVAIVGQMAVSVYNLYEKWLDVGAAAKKYSDELEKTQLTEYTQSHTWETTQYRILQATQAVQSYQQDARDAMHTTTGWAQALNDIRYLSSPIKYAYDRYQAKQLNDKSIQQQQLLDKLTHVQDISQYHEQRMLEINADHAGDARLRGEKKITAEKQKQFEINAENRRFDEERDRVVGYNTPKNAGAGKEKLQDAIAQQQADAQTYNLEREQSIELRHLREQALESRLHGADLYRAQEAAAIEDLKDRDMNSAAARNAIHERFHNQEMERLRQEQNATIEMQAGAAMTTWTGVRRIQAQGDIDIARVRGDNNLSDEAKEDRIGAIKIRVAGEVANAQKQFDLETARLADENAQRQVDGFARIRAAAQSQIDQVTQEFKKLYDTPELQKAHAGELNARVGLINSGAADQTAELRKRNADETFRIEAEAHARMLTSEQQQTAAIVEQYEERTRQYQEQLEKQQISQEDFDRRMAAAAETRDAEIAEAAKRQRDKMAGEFASFFRNPLNALKEMGDKAAGQTAAALVQHMEGRFGGATHSPLSGDFSIGSIMSRIAGRPNVTGIDRRAETAGMREVAAGVFSVSSAHIVVGSAAIAFGGATRGAMPSFAPAMMSAGAGIVPASFGGGASAGGGSFGVPDFTSAPSGSGGSSVMSNLSQGAGFARQAFSIFHGTGSSQSALGSPDVINTDLSGFHFGKNGQVVGGSTNGGMLGGGGFKSNIGGAAGGALGLFSAYESNGGVGGALSGAMGGMKLGMALGGPIGAAVGAAAGAIIGAMGFGGREKARVYDLKNVRPHIAETVQSYQTGAMNYLSAYSDMQSLDMEAKKTTNRMGPGGQRYYQDTIKSEVHQAEGRLTGEERGGRSNFGFSAAQFATGIDRVPYDGFAVLHKDESVFTADRTERMTRAFESMPNMASVAAGYRMAMTGNSARQPMSGGDRTLHMNVNAIDAKSVAQFFNANKHHMRAALNASYAENSGGADA